METLSMVDVYVELVKAGRKEIDKVPEVNDIQKQVRERLGLGEATEAAQEEVTQ